MRAPFIAVALVVIAAAGYFFFQPWQSTSPASAQAVTATESGQDATINQFKQLCVASHGNFAANDQAVRAAGWLPAQDHAHPMLARMMAIARSADPSQATTNHLVVYQRPDLGPAFVVLSDLTVSNIHAHGCHLYVFDASVPVSDAEMQHWLGAPQDSNAVEGAVSKRWVSPPSLPGVFAVQSAFARADSPVVATSFSGVHMALTSASN